VKVDRELVHTKMVNYCRVCGCHNRQDREKHLEFYRLPKIIENQGEKTLKLSEERRRLWLAQLHQNLDGKNLDNIRICSAHFVSGKKADLYKRDDPDWVPSLNMVPVKAAQKSGENSLAIRRFERCQRREEQRKATETESWDEGLSDNLEATETDSFTNNLYTQTDIDNDALTAMESELQALQAKNTQLHEQIKSNNKNLMCHLSRITMKRFYFLLEYKHGIFLSHFTVISVLI